VIVWLASYPRSGNTFFRVLLKHLYGQPTYSGFASGDITSRIGRGDLTGHEELPPRVVEAIARGGKDLRVALEELDRAPELYFIKTHRLSWADVDHGQRAVYLVRDPRDALSSHGWFLIDFARASTPRWSSLREGTLRQAAAVLLTGTLPVLAMVALRKVGLRAKLYRFVMRELLRARHEAGHGVKRWLAMNETWLGRPGRTALLRYEDLVADPIGAMKKTLDALGLDLPPTGDRFPSFAELQQVHGKFFRKGVTGGWADDLSPELAERICAAAATDMQRFGYTR
jgi:hypothetical protein